MCSRCCPMRCRNRWRVRRAALPARAPSRRPSRRRRRRSSHTRNRSSRRLPPPPLSHRPVFCRRYAGPVPSGTHSFPFRSVSCSPDLTSTHLITSTRTPNVPCAQLTTSQDGRLPIRFFKQSPSALNSTVQYEYSSILYECESTRVKERLFRLGSHLGGD